MHEAYCVVYCTLGEAHFYPLPVVGVKRPSCTQDVTTSRNVLYLT